jgi:hypothetical protein
MKPGPLEGSYRTQSADTSVEAEKMLFERLRELRPWEKAEILRALNRSARELALAGLRARHPDADEAELRMRLAEQYIGRDGVARVLGGHPRRRTS